MYAAARLVSVILPPEFAAPQIILFPRSDFGFSHRRPGVAIVSSVFNLGRKILSCTHSVLRLRNGWVNNRWFAVPADLQVHVSKLLSASQW